MNNIANLIGKLSKKIFLILFRRQLQTHKDRRYMVEFRIKIFKKKEEMKLYD